MNEVPLYSVSGEGVAIRHRSASHGSPQPGANPGCEIDEGLPSSI